MSISLNDREKERLLFIPVALRPFTTPQKKTTFWSKRLIAISAFLILFTSLFIPVAWADVQTRTFSVEPLTKSVLVFQLEEGDEVSGSLSVSGGAGNDIDFWVTNPAGNTILDLGRVSQGNDFMFTADRWGAYTLHFDNSFSVISSRIVTVTYYVAKLVTVKLVSASGRAVTDVSLTFGGVTTTTDVFGESTYRAQVGTYTVSAEALRGTVDLAVQPTSLSITATGTYTVQATAMSTLEVQVVGAQNQALAEAHVTITHIASGIVVFDGVTDQQGVASVELPNSAFSISAEYKGFRQGIASVTLPAGRQTIRMDVYTELFGSALTFSQLMLWTALYGGIAVLAVALILVWVRRRMVTPPPPPPNPAPSRL